MLCWPCLFTGMHQRGARGLVLHLASLVCGKGRVSPFHIAYADDIAVCSLYPNCMQYIIDVAFKYSQQRRFDFNPTKCAVLLFGESPNEKCSHKSMLGNKELERCTEYQHLGIVNSPKKWFYPKYVKDNVNRMKNAFFSTLGCSLRKTSLTPKALSKLYWSVAVPKLISGCEERYI